ncbi:hypothetical protein SRABI106_02923 [Rahnella aquatilis]|nr:hypothetical protein SRABI106_02923 [Rahnella aquatilis]
MKFQIIGTLLHILIDGSEQSFPNNPLGYKLMARAFCRSKGLV